jgi:hypothetical protein
VAVSGSAAQIHAEALFWAGVEAYLHRFGSSDCLSSRSRAEKEAGLASS